MELRPGEWYVKTYGRTHNRPPSSRTPRPRQAQSGSERVHAHVLIEDGLRLVTAENRNPAKTERVLPRISKATGGFKVDLTSFSKIQELEDLESIERVKRLK